jgi:hypothetical protein
MADGHMEAEARGLESIQEDELRRLHGYWRRKRGPDGWIRARDFRPEVLSSALPHVAVVARFPCATKRLVIKLAGHAIANVHLGFARDRYVGELRPDWYRDHLLASYDAALAAAEPVYQRVSIRYAEKAFAYSRLCLPMTRHGTECDQIIVGTILSPELATFLRRKPDFA